MVAQDSTGKFVATPLGERIWKFVQKSQDCWLWTGSKDIHGYGITSYTFNGRHLTMKAHRAVYLDTGHTIPDGYLLHHICGIKNCCNPDHLEPITDVAHLNLHRKQFRPRCKAKARAATCKYGHPMSGDNLYEHKGVRTCRTCNLRYTWLRRGGPPKPRNFPRECWRCHYKWNALLDKPGTCPKCRTRQKHEGNGGKIVPPKPRT